MRIKRSAGSRLFDALNYAFMGVLALCCILPVVHIMAISFSDKSSTMAGYVSFIPRNFNLSSYNIMVNDQRFFNSFLVSIERVALGVAVQMLITVLMAYPLSKEEKDFRGRTAYAWYMFTTILIGGGLIPWYMTIRSLGLLDRIWALILPGAVPVFNVVLLLNFFRQLPREMEEAAFIDGASHWQVLWRIFIPVSPPALATICLFSAIGHWNSWFDGFILMSKTDLYPLQTYVRAIVDFSQNISKLLGGTEHLEEMRKISNQTVRAAQVFLSALPIMLVYPFLQKYFMKGIIIGSVKG